MDKIILTKFGERVRSLRKLSNISIEELAYRCDLNRNYLSDVERGKRNLSLIAINKIAKGLDVPIDVLFID
jgi:transcriptional regulator with XRE-family HTH domain